MEKGNAIRQAKRSASFSVMRRRPNEAGGTDNVCPVPFPASYVGPGTKPPFQVNNACSTCTLGVLPQGRETGGGNVCLAWCNACTMRAGCNACIPMQSRVHLRGDRVGGWASKKRGPSPWKKIPKRLKQKWQRGRRFKQD